MGTYGPYTAQLNTVVAVTQLDPNADRLFIVNESIYTLAIGFGDSPPPAVATLTGEPWMFSVPPGGQLVPIPMRLFGASHYNGKVWILALDPISASQAYSGSHSSNAAFFVQTLLPGDADPGNYSTPQATNLASQPRIVTASAEPFYNLTGVWAPPLNNLNIFPNIWANNEIPNGLALGTARLIVRVHFLCLSIEGSAGDTGFRLQFVQVNGGGTDVVTAEILRSILTATTSSKVPFCPPLFQPLSVNVLTNAASAVGWLRLINDGGGTAQNVRYTILADIDWWNQQKIPGIGGGAGGNTDLTTGYNPSGGPSVAQLY